MFVVVTSHSTLQADNPIGGDLCTVVASVAMTGEVAACQTVRPVEVRNPLKWVHSGTVAGPWCPGSVGGGSVDN